MKIISVVSIVSIFLSGAAAQALECKREQIVAQKANVERALVSEIKAVMLEEAKVHEIRLTSISVKMTKIEKSHNAYGMLGARAQFKVQAITTKGNRIAWMDWTYKNPSAFEVWLVPIKHVGSGSEGSNVYCGSFFKFGGYNSTFVNLETGEAFTRGYYGSRDAHIVLKTGAVKDGWW